MLRILSGLTATAIILLCAAPGLAANVWPRLVKLTAEPSGPEIGIAAALGLSVLALAAAPFSMERDRKFWFVSLGAGIILTVFNFVLAVEVSTKWRGDTTKVAAETIAKAAGLKERIAATRGALDALLPGAPTTQAAVDAAKWAANAAATDREDECNRRGKAADLCRAREIELKLALAALARVTDARGLAEQRERLTAELSQLGRDLDGLGLVPGDADPTAAKVAAVLGLLVNLGDDPVKAVGAWLPVLTAAVIELLALIGPRLFLGAIGKLGPVQPATAPATSATTSATTLVAKDATTKKLSDLNVRLLQEVVAKEMAIATTAATSATTLVAVVADDVACWFRTCTTPRPGAKLKPKEAYEN